VLFGEVGESFDGVATPSQVPPKANSYVPLGEVGESSSVASPRRAVTKANSSFFGSICPWAEVGESSVRIAAFTMGYFVVLAALVGYARFLDRIIRHSGQGRPSATPARL
jgi:hypothetical protein